MCLLFDSLLGIEEGKKICFLTHDDPKEWRKQDGSSRWLSYKAPVTDDENRTSLRHSKRITTHIARLGRFQAVEM